MGDPVVAALIVGSAALTGAVLGGCLSWLGAYLNDRRTWRREDSRRFEAERRAAYSRLLGCIAKVVNKHDTLSGNRLGTQDELVADWFSALAEVELIASDEVWEAARSFTMIVNDTLFNRQSSLPVDAWGNSRKRFITAVRKEMGIKTDGPQIAPH